MERSEGGAAAGTGTTAAPPQVEGYGTGRLLGVGASAEVWTATETATGRAVAIKVLQVQGPEHPTRREAALLRRIDHPHLLALLRSTRTTDGRTALVTELAAGGSLAALVRARGALDPGEVVTVLTPLAGALADLHERGVVHGDVSAGNVLFLADGRPVIADLGTAGLLGVDPATHATPGYADPALAAGAPLAPASDVHALGALAWFALTAAVPERAGQRPPLAPVAPGTPPELAALVERCLDPEPARRPGAAEVAVQAFRAAAAAPVRLVPTDPHALAAEVVTHRLRQAAAPVPAPAAAPRRRRRAVVAAVAAVAALIVGGLGVAAVLTQRPDRPAQAAGGEGSDPARTTAPSTPPSTAPTPSTAPSTTASTTAPTAVPTSAAATTAAAAGEEALGADDPLVAVPALSALRAQGFSTADAGPLRAANVAGSPALVADLATLAELDQQGLRLDGLAFALADAEVVSRDGASATVEVTVVTGAHRVVDGAGAVVEDVAASDPAQVRLVLQRVDGRWQVSEVR